MNTTELYQQYKEQTQKAADLQYASAVLGWDQEVYMPQKGFGARGRQLATLATLAHEMVTSGTYGDLLRELSQRNDLNDEQQNNIRLSLEDYEKNAKLPTEFVDKITQQTSASYDAWLRARKENDYSIYAPELEKMIALKKQQAELYGYKEHPYDALLDEYEKGATVSLLDGVFEKVKAELPGLLKKIANAPQVDASFFHQEFLKDAQWNFSLDVLRQMGYDFEAGRQDISEHPFTTSFAATDVRVTTRVNEQDYTSLLWSSIHEGGHALYEQGLPESQYGLPLGAAASLAVHESQSRLWENCVGRSLDFWTFFYPKLKTYFPQQLEKTSVQDFYKGMNQVKSSLIRTEADEITYHFHVLIRYEIEKALIGGTLSPKDLKETWNDYYEKYLGVRPNDDKHGVLQDVHWCHGSFGYFPTYSLGSFYAAQYFGQAANVIPSLHEEIKNGVTGNLLHWLRENIHQYGRRYTSEELCKKVTGKGLDFSVFMNYLQQKYSGIYAIG
ncbi:carboxypeptidase M32 [Taibaiella soli]|uniref:Metal-dependent carboxypeptidase n=1 Tax=Taibaiella soli TaxID=1649169 RepID=A0A2W2B450_9BACT|nr:carboxypeptidase M32 [Taibaiella soli]PZF70907.1 carboxypeptidase M32 [Taibaiella soli]